MKSSRIEGDTVQISAQYWIAFYCELGLLPCDFDDWPLHDSITFVLKYCHVIHASEANPLSLLRFRPLFFLSFLGLEYLVP